MATVTPPRTTRNLAQDRSRIKSPLARLRNYIHAYVSLEGAALVGLFLALWFWIGLFLDYGLFKTFYFDWVQQDPNVYFRATVLIALCLAAIAIVALKIFTRLFIDFTDAAIAVVLERRFPKQLGDRLITAVELSDPVAAAAYGYSADMVKETIHQAADRVAEVPVREVFDWKRLIVRGVGFALLTLGLYLLVGAGFSVARAVYDEEPVIGGYSDFNDVSTIWFERNILLRNTIWPRRAHLEIVGFPENLRIPREGTPPTLRVRAWKYVIADRDAPEGWRLLTWKDLQKNPDLAGADVPGLPQDWQPRDEDVGMTVDEAELKHDAFAIRVKAPDKDLKGRWFIASDTEESGWRPLLWKDLSKERLGSLNPPALPREWEPKGAALEKSTSKGAKAPVSSLSVEEVEKLKDKANPKTLNLDAIGMVFARLERLSRIREALDQLDERLTDRALRRSVRKLLIPTEVTLEYQGARTTNTNTMTRVADNEFTGTFGELKESVSFTVKGEDYRTAKRSITVVDRPRLEKLESEEERPAYIYYRPPTDGSPGELRGLRQPFVGVPMSVSGDATSIEVPMSTTLTLTATCTKKLVAVELFAEKKDQKTLTAEKPVLLDDGRSFRSRVPNIRREQRFTFRFTDEDDVVAERKIIILPKEDVPPRVREFAPDEIIRRAKEGYLIAVGCRIPFKAHIGDDYGLSRVRYACRVIPGDFLSEQKVRSLFGVGAVPLLAPGPGTQLMTGLGYLTALHRELASAAGEEASAEQSIDLPGFTQLLQDPERKLRGNRPEFLPLGEVRSLLALKQADPYRQLTREFKITPDNWTMHDRGPDPHQWRSAQDQTARLECDLPVWALLYKDKPLKDPNESRPQKRFIVEVRLVAEDTYLEGDIDPKTKQPIPHISPSVETFTFVVVPENELLSRIAEEEETRYRELQKAYKPLPDYNNHMRDMYAQLSAALTAGGLQTGELNAYVARCDAMMETLKASEKDTKEVAGAYVRIVREMRTNQLREDVVSKVYRTISEPLGRVADIQFSQTVSAVADLRKALDNPEQAAADRIKAARPRAAVAYNYLKKLVADLEAILGAMEGLSKINELIEELRRIEKEEDGIEERVRKILGIRIRQALEPDKK